MDAFSVVQAGAVDTVYNSTGMLLASLSHADCVNVIGEINLAEANFSTVYQFGTWHVLIGFYFLIYQHMKSMKLMRDGNFDHFYIHSRVLYAINCCAAGNFDDLFNIFLNINV